MSFFYDDDKGGKGYVSIAELDSVSCYLTHYNNFIFLKFVSLKSEDLSEKFQAEKEIKICNRKLDFWERRLSPEEWKSVVNTTLTINKKWQFDPMK